MEIELVEGVFLCGGDQLVWQGELRVGKATLVEKISVRYDFALGETWSHIWGQMFFNFSTLFTCTRGIIKWV